MLTDVMHLESIDSTNAWAKANFAAFAPLGAVWTTCQTAGRGRLGRSWENAAGQALYYTCVIKTPLAQPETLPLFASLALRDALRARYGVECAIKWPNDLLLGGKKIAGILCEGVATPQGRGIVCGIGVNLAQPQSYFDKANLPHATSLALQNVAVDLEADPQWLAENLTDFGFDRSLYAFERDGFAACRASYNAACINLGKAVQYEGGQGIARDVDENGRLVVEEQPGGVRRIFTGEVSVQGVYGQL